MNLQNEAIIQKTNTMLSGEIQFYNRFTHEIVHRVDMKDVDTDEYQHSDEFYQILLEKEIGSVRTIAHYENWIINKAIYIRGDSLEDNRVAPTITPLITPQLHHCE